MSAAVLQSRATSLPAAIDSVTTNSTSSPSAAVAAPTDTVAVPGSVIVVVAAVGLYSAVPAVVLAPVRVTINVSPRSSTRSEVVWIVIVPLDDPAAMVNEPLGAV